MAKLLALISILLTSLVYSSTNKSAGYFSGRVSKFNESAGIVRFKVDFDNVKYLSKHDAIEFWVQHQSQLRCSGVILGRSSHHILVKVPKYRYCNEMAVFAVGRYYHFHSEDLVNNISMGKELTGILLKKRLALGGKIKRNEKLVETYIQRLDAVNSRYEVLKQKLLAEWREELAKLEDDQQELVRNNEGLKLRLNEVNHKLEKYRVEDENLSLDRWSLDPNYYYLK